MFLAAPPPPYLLHGGKQLARPRNVRLLPAERRHGLARPGSGPEVRTPTPLISQWDGQVRKGSDENPGRREGRDGRASLGHTHTAAAAAAALLAGSCMPSWAERSEDRRLYSRWKGSLPALPGLSAESLRGPASRGLPDRSALPRHSPKGGGPEEGEP